MKYSMEDADKVLLHLSETLAQVILFVEHMDSESVKRFNEVRTAMAILATSLSWLWMSPSAEERRNAGYEALHRILAELGSEIVKQNPVSLAQEGIGLPLPAGWPLDYSAGDAPDATGRN